MNAELEALVHALDAVFNAGSGVEAKRLEAVYQAMIDDLQTRAPRVPRKDLLQMVAAQHFKWLKAEKRFPTIPPKA
jgi:hypothetical protein